MAADVIQATKHKVITASPDELVPVPSGIYVNADGDFTATLFDPLTDKEVSITYNVTAGTLLPIRPYRITAATATVIGLY